MQSHEAKPWDLIEKLDPETQSSLRVYVNTRGLCYSPQIRLVYRHELLNYANILANQDRYSRKKLQIQRARIYQIFKASQIPNPLQATNNLRSEANIVFKNFLWPQYPQQRLSNTS